MLVCMLPPGRERSPATHINAPAGCHDPKGYGLSPPRSQLSQQLQDQPDQHDPERTWITPQEQPTTSEIWVKSQSQLFQIPNFGLLKVVFYLSKWVLFYISVTVIRRLWILYYISYSYSYTLWDVWYCGKLNNILNFLFHNHLGDNLL